MNRISEKVLSGLISLTAFTLVFAAPPGSQYSPGETLAPTCAPGDANCSVTAPLTEITDGSISLSKLMFSPTVPARFGDVAKVSSEQMDSLKLYLEVQNVSGATIDLTGYQLWLSFYNEEGATIAKPSTSTAFDPETVTEISMPAATINDGDVFSYTLDLGNIWAELEDYGTEHTNILSQAKGYSLFMRYLDGGGTTNFGFGTAIRAFYLTPYIAAP